MNQQQKIFTLSIQYIKNQKNSIIVNIEQEKIINIFYSWQSDLNRDTNQKGILYCIKKANLDIESIENSLTISIDEATSNKPGSPNIPDTIFAKILNTDIFICDISTINNNQNSIRKTPNPNVLVELGYAIANLGWERIIMLFNKKFGTFPNDIPFDLEKRRIILYEINDKNDKNGKSNLTQKLCLSIKEIIASNPPFSKNNNQSDIKRKKDIENIELLFKHISISTIEIHIQKLPQKIMDRIHFFWTPFEAYFNSNFFHLYDELLYEKILNFKNSWSKTLSYAQHFSTNDNGKSYIFHIPFDVFTDVNSEKDFRDLTKESLKLGILFKDLIKYIRLNYVEVDIDKLSAAALKECQNYEKEFETKFNLK